MSKGAYIGVGNSSRKLKSIYVGVENVSKKVKAAYVGIGGAAKRWWPPLINPKYLSGIYSEDYSGKTARADSYCYGVLPSYGCCGGIEITDMYTQSKLYFVNKSDVVTAHDFSGLGYGYYGLGFGSYGNTANKCFVMGDGFAPQYGDTAVFMYSDNLTYSQINIETRALYSYIPTSSMKEMPVASFSDRVIFSGGIFSVGSSSIRYGTAILSLNENGVLSIFQNLEEIPYSYNVIEFNDCIGLWSGNSSGEYRKFMIYTKDMVLSTSPTSYSFRIPSYHGKTTSVGKTAYVINGVYGMDILTSDGVMSSSNSPITDPYSSIASSTCFTINDTVLHICIGQSLWFAILDANGTAISIQKIPNSGNAWNCRYHTYFNGSIYGTERSPSSASVQNVALIHKVTL